MRYLLLIYDRAPRAASPDEVMARARSRRPTTPSPSSSGRGAYIGRRGAPADARPRRPSASATARRSRPTARSPRPRRRSAASTSSRRPTSTRRSTRRAHARAPAYGSIEVRPICELAEGGVTPLPGSAAALTSAGRGDRDAADAHEVVDRLFREEQGGRSRRSSGSSATSTSPRRRSRRRSSRRSRPGPTQGVPDNPGAWITTTARNRAIDRLRRRARAAREDRGAASRCDEAAETDGPGARRDRPDAAEDEMHDRRRPAAADLHLLPPGAAAGRAGRADAAHARRPDDARDRPRLPRPGADPRPAARPRQAEDPRRRHPVPRAADRRCCRSASTASCGSCTSSSTRATPASSGDALVRRELCAEAIRLARLVATLLPDEPEALGPARADAAPRRPARGAQSTRPASSSCSRTRTGRAGTGARSARAARSSSVRCAPGRPGPYQLQAAIAALHDEAATRGATDWPQIAALYATLAGARAVAGGRAQPRGRGGDGRRARGRPRDDRRPRWPTGASTTTRTCTPPGPTCCAGSAAGPRRPPPIVARSPSRRTHRATVPGAPAGRGGGSGGATPRLTLMVDLSKSRLIRWRHGRPKVDR